MVDSKDEKKNNNIKIIVIGDQAVGKSSLLMRYCEGNFTLNMMGTAGIDFKRKIIEINKTKLSITFYDSAGHDRFRHITKTHYQGSKGIVLVYDVTDKASFTNVNEWINNIKENADSNAEIILIGNKIDLDSDRIISYEDGLELAKQYGVSFIETSAKSNDGVDKAFMKIITQIIENKALNKDIVFKSEDDNKGSENTKSISKDNVINIEKSDKQTSKTNNKGSCFKCG